MSERSKETVLKTVVGKPTASSNLASSANGVSSQSLETFFFMSKTLDISTFLVCFPCFSVLHFISLNTIIFDYKRGV